MGVQYLVTGAAGHLGNTVVRQLTESGQTVRCLVLDGDNVENILPSPALIFRGNVLDKSSMMEFFNLDAGEKAVVIHCAGIVSITMRYQQVVYDVNVRGTKNIVDLCIEHNVEKLVYVSSVHAIPEIPKGTTIKEVKEFDPDKVVGLYAKTKAEATRIVLNATDRGLNASVVHPSGICGPYDYGSGHMTQMLIDCYKGRLFAGVAGGYDFVDVRDVAEGIISCCRKGRPGDCYILSNQYFSVKQIFEMFSDVTGMKTTKIILPMWLAKATASLSEKYYAIVKRKPLFTPYSMYTLSSNAGFSHEKAAIELDYKVRPFKETIRDTLEWLKSQNRP